jgi:lambda family phage portal protein
MIYAQKQRSLGERIDAAIYALFPRWGTRRKMARAAWEASRRITERYQRAWEAADDDRFRGHKWLTSRLSPDSALAEDLDQLRSRSYDLVRNDAYAAGAIDSLVCNVVGDGIRPQARILPQPPAISEEQARRWNDELEDLFDRWAYYAGRDGVSTLWDLQRQAIYTWAAGGDCFLVMSDVGRSDAPIPLALELIAPERCVTPPEEASNPLVRLGIEYDESGRRVAYWFRSAHPGDTFDQSETYQRIEAWRVCHLYRPIFPGQSRGFPMLAPVMGLLKDLKDFREATIIGEQVAACFTVFVTGGNPMLNAVNAAAATDKWGSRLQEIAPGRIEYLADGSEVTIANPNRPSNTIGPFIETNLKAIAAGINFPYELFIHSYAGTTYSSGRLSLLEARQMFSTNWQAPFIWHCCMPLWRRVVEEAVATGEVSIPGARLAADYERVVRHAWIGRGQPWIDPTKDVAAARDAIEANLTTKTEECAARGRDFEEICRARQRENALEAMYGIIPPPRVGAAPTNQPSSPAPVAEEGIPA